MQIRRVKTVQVHPVPKSVYRPGNIFDADVTRSGPVIRDYEPEDEFPPGATPGNDMQGVPMYRCNRCELVVAETELEAHRC